MAPAIVNLQNASSKAVINQIFLETWRSRYTGLSERRVKDFSTKLGIQAETEVNELFHQVLKCIRKVLNGKEGELKPLFKEVPGKLQTLIVKTIRGHEAIWRKDLQKNLLFSCPRLQSFDATLSYKTSSNTVKRLNLARWHLRLNLQENSKSDLMPPLRTVQLNLQENSKSDLMPPLRKIRDQLANATKK